MKIIISPYSKPLRNGKRNAKNYPYWNELVQLLCEAGHEITQIAVGGEKVIEYHSINVFTSLPYWDILTAVLTHDIFISIDNFFPHFCHYYGKPGIVLFSRSDPKIFGYPENINLLKDSKYLRPDQFGLWESCDYIENAFVWPERVFGAIQCF